MPENYINVIRSHIVSSSYSYYVDYRIDRASSSELDYGMELDNCQPCILEICKEQGVKGIDIISQLSLSQKIQNFNQVPPTDLQSLVESLNENKEGITFQVR